MLDRNEVYLGDCLDWMELIDAGSIDCIITDPPYGINYKSSFQGYDNRNGLVKTGKQGYFRQIANDSSLPTAWLSSAYKVLKDGGAMYVFSHWTKWCELSMAVEQAQFKVKNMIVLNKSNSGMGDLKGAYSPKHELLLFAVKGRHIMNVPPRLNDVWDVKVLFSGRKRFHPNQKHLGWMKPAIEQSTKRGDLVLDPFAGSGSTLCACAETGRDFIGIELEPEYVDICEARIKEANAGQE